MTGIASIPRQVSVWGDGALDLYVRAIRAHLGVVAATTMAAIGAAVAAVALSSAPYEATAKVLALPVSQDDRTFLGIDLLRDSGDPTRTQQTAAALLDSHGAAARAAAMLGSGYSAEDVQAAVSIQPLGQSNVVVVKATASTARDAARLANRYAKAALALRFAHLRRQVTAAIAQLRRAEGGIDTTRVAELQTILERGDPTLRIAQFANPPPAPDDTPLSLAIALGALAGFTLGSVAALMLSRHATA